MFYCALATLAAGQSINEPDVAINKRPMKDFAARVKSEIEAKKVDLASPFLIELKGSLASTGKIDPKTTKLTRSEGDAAMIQIAKEAITAVNEAGYFQYLKDLRAETVTISIEQNSSEFSANFWFPVESSKRAKTVVMALDLALNLAKIKKQQPNASEADKKDLFFLESTKVSSEDVNVLFSVRAPSEKVRMLIEEELKKQDK